MGLRYSSFETFTLYPYGSDIDHFTAQLQFPNDVNILFLLEVNLFCKAKQKY